MHDQSGHFSYHIIGSRLRDTEYNSKAFQECLLLPPLPVMCTITIRLPHLVDDTPNIVWQILVSAGLGRQPDADGCWENRNGKSDKFSGTPPPKNFTPHIRTEWKFFWKFWRLLRGIDKNVICDGRGDRCLENVVFHQSRCVTVRL